MPPKATTASVSTPATPTVNVENHLKDASKNARESEVGDGPEGNWEVAVSLHLSLSYHQWTPAIRQKQF